jgi:transposase InsO family protein
MGDTMEASEASGMAWDEGGIVENRVRFIEAVHRGEDDISALCRQFGVSRKTGYKWIARAEQGEALVDRSRAPQSRPNTTSERVRDLILKSRREHPTWGPRKLLAWLSRKYPAVAFPAASTVGEMLKRAALIRPRRVRLRPDPNGASLTTMDAPNAVWCADFKGAFRTGDGRVVNALTVTDGFSRYLLRCTAMTLMHTVLVQKVYDAMFREFGLPAVMRTDNGPPFAAMGPRGLSKLGVWLLKLGIKLERSRPGKPQENGRHERMHRTLKQDTASPPAKTIKLQQQRFDLFVRTYNEERPHEALENETPASVYVRSALQYPTRLREFEYPSGHELRIVRHNGDIRWQGRCTYVCQALAGENVGIEPCEDGTWRVHFGPLCLGGLDERGRFDRTLREP